MCRLTEHLSVSELEDMTDEQWGAFCWNMIDEEWCGEDMDSIMEMCRDHFGFDSIRRNLGIRKGWFASEILRPAVEYQRKRFRDCGL